MRLYLSGLQRKTGRCGPNSCDLDIDSLDDDNDISGSLRVGGEGASLPH